MATQPKRGPERTVLIIAGVVAAVAVLGVVVALVVGGDDDKPPIEEVLQPVEVSGEPLPPYSREAADAAVGMEVPVVTGVDYAGNATTIDPASDGPTMIVLLAHWCPHCNAEIPVLNEWRDSGGIPEELNIVGVSTGVERSGDNYPPGEWLEELDWQWPVLADDAPIDDDTPPPAMNAYGGTSYPTMIFVDGDGRVLLRYSGELPLDALDQLVDEVLAIEAAAT